MCYIETWWFSMVMLVFRVFFPCQTWIRRIFRNPAQVSISNVTAGSKIASWFVVSWFASVLSHTIHVWYIYLYICLISMVNVSKYTIHGCYGFFLGQGLLLVLSISHLKITKKTPRPVLGQYVARVFCLPASCANKPIFRWIRSRRGIPPQLVFEIQPPGN